MNGVDAGKAYAEINRNYFVGTYSVEVFGWGDRDEWPSGRGSQKFTHRGSRMRFPNVFRYIWMHTVCIPRYS